MIILRLEGGLGNQLFQYSYGHYLSKKFGLKLLFDTRPVRNCDIQRGLLKYFGRLTACYPIRLRDQILIALMRVYAFAMKMLLTRAIRNADSRAILLSKIGIINQVGTGFIDYSDYCSTRLVYVQGNWMSEKFFSDTQSELADDLQLNFKISSSAEKYAKLIAITESVCVHVRLGDYLEDKWRGRLHVCTPEYYRKGVEELASMYDGLKFFIFTNDRQGVEWIKEVFDFLPDDSVYIELFDKDIEDFALMKNCKHFILSNSTFSWWASFLNGKEESTVIAPSRWNNGAWDVRDIYRTKWLLIDP